MSQTLAKQIRPPRSKGQSASHQKADRGKAAERTEPKQETLDGPAEVIVVGYIYRVRWLNGSFHHVTKEKVCKCELGKTCPSLERVKEYLEDGGERAPDYPEDYWHSVPKTCPVCSSACESHPNLDFHAHGRGWKCSVGGTLHYWQARVSVISKMFKPPLLTAHKTEWIEAVHLRWQGEGYEPWN